MLSENAGRRFRVSYGNSDHKSTANRLDHEDDPTDTANFLIAVLGLHAIKNRPVAVDGKIEIRPVCPTSCWCIDSFG